MPPENPFNPDETDLSNGSFGTEAELLASMDTGRPFDDADRIPPALDASAFDDASSPQLPTDVDASPGLVMRIGGVSLTLMRSAHQNGATGSRFQGSVNDIGLNVSEFFGRALADLESVLDIETHRLPLPDVVVDQLFVAYDTKQESSAKTESQTLSFVARLLVGASKKPMDLFLSADLDNELFLFGLRAGSIKLSELPLIGKFEGLKDVSLNDLGLVYASQPGSFDVPSLEDTGKPGEPPRLVFHPMTFEAAGLVPSASLHLPTDKDPLTWSAAPASGQDSPPAGLSDVPPDSDSDSDGTSPIKWKAVNKTLGPVTIQKVGLGYDAKPVASTNAKPSYSNPQEPGSGTAAYSTNTATQSIIKETLAGTILGNAKLEPETDGTVLKGIAIASATGNGTWQYSTDGETWAPFGTIPEPKALHLNSKTKVRFVADSEGSNNEIEFWGWDESLSTATLAISAAFTLAGVTLDLQGLKVSTSFEKFAPKFGLDGLGLDVRRGPLEIGGAFLHRGEDYAGMAVIRTAAFALTAVGGYQQFHGKASLFLYAFLDYPLGGPPFFFVEGLAAGFGVNRRFIAPPIDEVGKFPLITEAMSGQSGIADPAQAREGLAAELDKLLPHLAPEVGENFLMLGVKFNSFKQIDSFVLVTVSFGRKLLLDVLGLSTMQVPAPIAGNTVTPLAFVQMALKAHFDPQDGFLSVQAQLTDQSYILAKTCRLQGGFAFYSWFGGQHAGDFVATLGGYHPRFTVPAHYPQPTLVPRLGMNWQVDAQTTIKGTAYYALTPSAVMAGGSLEVNWHDGKVRAWFTMGVDFLMEWKPFHYEADAHVEIGASVTIHFFGTHHLTVSAGAELSIRGPEFSGIAHVHLKVMGVKVKFTTSFGHGSNTKPPPIAWQEFQETFLPAPEAVVALRASHGVLRTIEERAIVNAKEFCAVVDSAIPITILEAGDLASGESAIPKFGIKPMNKTDQQVSSTLTINIAGNDGAKKSFVAVPVFKKVPAALWSSSASRSDPHLVEALAGYTIHPAKPPTPGASKYIQDSKLQYEVTVRDLRLDQNDSATHQSAAPPDDLVNALENSSAARTLLLKQFNFPSSKISGSLDDESLAKSLVESLVVPPVSVE